MGRYYKKNGSIPLEKVEKPAYRYFCDACTGIAFTSDKREAMRAGFCESCGSQYMTRLENYLKNN